ncbi:MAG: hypothetical protein ABH814_02675 [bacterium]
MKAVPVYPKQELGEGKASLVPIGFKVGKKGNTPLPVIQRAVLELGLADGTLLTLSDVSKIGNRVAEIMTGR